MCGVHLLSSLSFHPPSLPISHQQGGSPLSNVSWSWFLPVKSQFFIVIVVCWMSALRYINKAELKWSFHLIALGGKAAIMEWAEHTLTALWWQDAAEAKRPSFSSLFLKFQAWVSELMPNWGFLKRNKAPPAASSCANWPCSVTVGDKCFSWVCTRVSYCKHITRDSARTLPCRKSIFPAEQHPHY